MATGFKADYPAVFKESWTEGCTYGLDVFVQNEADRIELATKASEASKRMSDYSVKTMERALNGMGREDKPR